MDNPLFTLTDKTIVVTGASSGIGRACALMCARQGARLVLMGRDAARLQQTLEMTGNETRHLTFQVDLCAHEAVEEGLTRLLPQMGRVGGVVHCAGISTTLPFKLVKDDKLQHFFDTNVFGAMHLTRCLMKPAFFEETGGSVVFIASVMGMVGSVGKSLYSMSKGALLAASRALALEYAPKNIRFNCISPGVVETPMSANAVYSRDEATLNQIRALHPLGLGQPDDVAHATVFLLSDQARWITGSNLVVDGGYTAR